MPKVLQTSQGVEWIFSSGYDNFLLVSSQEVWEMVGNVQGSRKPEESYFLHASKQPYSALHPSQFKAETIAGRGKCECAMI